MSRPFSIALDAMRAFAAVLVLLGHAVHLGIYTGPWPFDRTLQHSAVVLFFVLSGWLIHESATAPGARAQDFVVARAARILPVALVATIVSALIYHGCVRHGVALPVPPAEQSVGDDNVVWPLLFMSESPNRLTPVANPPYWSLCYEVWFYALFGAWFFLRGRARIAATALLALLAGPNILVLMPVWLIGARAASAPVEAAGSSTRRLWAQIGIATALFWAIPSFGICIGAASWLKNAGFGSLRHSQFVLTDIPMGACVAMILVDLRALAARGALRLDRLARPARALAGCSYSLYLLHWPILSAMLGMGMVAGPSAPRFATLMLVPLAIAWAVALPLERMLPRALRAFAGRHDRVRRTVTI